MRIVRPCDQDYDSSRAGANARIDLEPLYICFCENDDDVREVMKLARERDLAVRVRSGRHHHEGMSSGNGVAIIDVSAMNSIVVNNDETVTVGAGAKLKHIYDRMDEIQRILPGGGCADVCVGGLVQGAGWGLYARAFGMTCDQLYSFRMVQVDGTSRLVWRNTDPDLFWAVCGGGGGNFGVMTEFTFRLNARPGKIWSVTLSWANKDLIAPVVKQWIGNFPNTPDPRFTSFCRVTANDGSDKPEAPVAIAGNFLGGTENDVTDAMTDLLGSDLYGKAIPVIKETPTPHMHPLYQPAPPSALASEGQVDLTSTCDGIPYPHKVSSCFPRVDFGDAQVNAIAGYVTKSTAVPHARRYLSLHSLGGKVKDSVFEKNSSFTWRRKDFMLQYQAWWQILPGSNPTDICMEWVIGFRDLMRHDGSGEEKWTEGSFINFPDRTLPVSSCDPVIARNELLKYYYGHNLERLMGIKARLDPCNFLDFPMGIPPS